jgi:hypothetical protein
MAKKKTNSKPTVDERNAEIERIDKLITTLDGYSVPALPIDRSLEECRSLNDKLALVKVDALEIDSPTLYVDYGALFRRCKAIEKKLEEQRVNEKAPHLEAGRVCDAKYKGFSDLTARLRKLIDKCLGAWDAEQERIRRQTEKELRERARKEQERLDRAAAKKAAKLEEQGKEDEADAVREAVPQVPTPVVEQSNIPKVAGVSKRKNWTAEITAEALDKQEKLIIEMIKSWNSFPANKNKQIIPGEYWSLDVKKIGAMARSLKGKLELPDVNVFDADSRY